LDPPLQNQKILSYNKLCQPPQQTKSSIQQITKGPKKLKFEKFEKFEMFFPKMNLVWDVVN